MNDDLPGMLAVAKGVAEQKFPHTVDAAVWTAEFMKLHPDADEGVMLGWFANAIMAGYDTASARSAIGEKWIPVSERKPENYDTVLIVDGDGIRSTGFWNGSVWLVDVVDEIDGMTITPTHWMTLPAAPMLDLMATLKHEIKKREEVK